MDRLADLAFRARRAVLRRRRLLAASLTAAAVGATVQATSPPAPPDVPVLVANHDLPGGHAVRPGDVRVARFAPGTAPAGALGGRAAALGRTLTGPLRSGTPLTDVALLGEGLLATLPGRVATPVRFPDEQAASLLRTGDLVDLVAADPSGAREAVSLAAATPVLAVPPAGSRQGNALAGGRLVVLAVPESAAGDVLTAALGGYLTFTFSR